MTINMYSGAWACSLDRVPVPVFLVGKCLNSFITSESTSTFDSILSLDFRAAFTKTRVESQLGRLFKSRINETMKYAKWSGRTKLQILDSS